jgi:hypothetical protein
MLRGMTSPPAKVYGVAEQTELDGEAEAVGRAATDRHRCEVDLGEGMGAD